MTRTLLLAGFAAVVSLAAPPDAPQRPRITGIAHIALSVHDIAQSRIFYKDFLGFGEPYKLDNPNGSLSLTFIKVNERQYIELFPEKAPKTIGYCIFHWKWRMRRRCVFTLLREA